MSAAACKRKYIRILKLELEDLREDVELLIARQESRLGRERETHYVFLENLALLKHRILDLDRISAILDQFDLDQCADLDALIKAVDLRFHNLAQHHGLTEAVYGLLKRKLEKVARYVREPPC